MNTALFSAHVEYHGDFWIVKIAGKFYPAKTINSLAALLSGDIPDIPENIQKENETIPEFLARGGVIRKSRNSRNSKSLRLPPAQLNLDDLTAERIFADLNVKI